MPDELDQYRLKQVEEKTTDNAQRLDKLERAEENRDLNVEALKATVKANSALVALVILAIVGAALGVFFGVGR